MPSLPNTDNYIPNSEDEVSEAELPPDEDDFETLEKTPISFRLSRPNERQSRVTSPMKSR